MNDKSTLALQSVPSLPEETVHRLPAAGAGAPWDLYAIPTYTRVTIPTRLERGKQGLLRDVAKELRAYADELEVIASDQETKPEFLMTRVITAAKRVNGYIKLHSTRYGLG